MKKYLQVLRVAAWMMLPCAAATALGLMFYTGRHNQSIVLMALFTAWISAPFIALLLANALSNGWNEFTRTILYAVILLVTCVSVVIYGNVALGSPRAQPAFYFLTVPLMYWFLIALIPIVGRIHRTKM